MRNSLFPDDVRPVQLHRDDGPLTAAVERCKQRGWAVAELDASRWTQADGQLNDGRLDDDQLHDDLAAALWFPEHYGRNLDALVDQLGELPRSTDPRLADATGLVIVVRGVDHLLNADVRRGVSLLEILTEAALGALRFGWPVAVVLQAEEPVKIPPLAPTTVEWNRSERRRPNQA